jgi:putative Holliday junction resolvase
MMRTAAFDLGDAWIGVAIADPLGIIASPHETIRACDLETYIASLVYSLHVDTIVVGYPRTLRDTASDQTRKIELLYATLQQKFPSIRWVLWDERFTSKQASSIKRTKTKDQKLQQHAIAAALILQSYLERQLFLKNQSESRK